MRYGILWLSLVSLACAARPSMPVVPSAAATGSGASAKDTATPGATGDVLRIGTIAPPGSKWASELRKMAAEIRKETRGDIRIKFTYTDIAGDEGEVLRMIEEKKLEGAAITGVGIEKIAPAFLVQQLPLMFRNYGELDCMRAQLGSKFDAMFVEKGFVPLAFADVGFVYLFTKDEVRSQEQLEKIKMWSWEHDKIGSKMLDLGGIKGIKMMLPDVGEGLKTGALEAFYGTPYGVVVMHWHHYAKYMLPERLALVVGAMVLTKAAFETIPVEHRDTLRNIAKKYSASISTAIRKQNAKARAALEKKLQLVRLAPGENSIWITIAEKTQDFFVDKLYPRALLDEVKGTIAQCRKKAAKTP